MNRFIVEDLVCIFCLSREMRSCEWEGETGHFDCKKCGQRVVFRKTSREESVMIAKIVLAMSRAKERMRQRHNVCLDDFIAHANVCGACQRGSEGEEGEWAKINTAEMCPVGQALGVPAGRILSRWGYP